MGDTNTLSLSSADATRSPHTTLGYSGQKFSAGVAFAPRGHSALTGAIFVCHSWGGRCDGHPVGERPGMLPNTREAQDGPTMKISPKISTVSGVTSPGGSAGRPRSPWGRETLWWPVGWRQKNGTDEPLSALHLEAAEVVLAASRLRKLCGDIPGQFHCPLPITSAHL